MASIRQVRFKRIILLSLIVAVCIVCLSSCINSANNKRNNFLTSKQSKLDNEIRTDRPPTAKTLYVMANILASQGKDIECEAVYKKIIQKYPDFLPVYNNLAELQIRQGRIDEAIETIKSGLHIHPGDPLLSNNLGMCRIIRKEYEEALKMFTEAADVMPENARYRANMAMALAMLGRYEESLSLYKQILPEDKANYNLSILQKSRENSNTSSQVQLDNMDMMQSDTQTTIDEEK